MTLSLPIGILKDKARGPQNHFEYFAKDFEETPHGLLPGAWIKLIHRKKEYLGTFNAFSQNQIICRTMGAFPHGDWVTEEELATSFIETRIQLAVQKRFTWRDFDRGCRLIYGASDGLPGLIVDLYQNAALIQIHSAGLDRFREKIKLAIEKHIQAKAVFLDDPKLREIEGLPQFPGDDLPSFIEVYENGCLFKLEQDIWQKIGFYYDHRFNRKRLKMILSELNFKGETALDLFSYVGAWGFTLLKEKFINRVDFIDQAHLGPTFIENAKLNGCLKQAHFHRQDVFSYLVKAHKEGQRYSLIISDPPAFSKTKKNREKALHGYRKLAKNCLKLITDEGGVFVMASCTHGVSNEDLDRLVQLEAVDLGRQVQLLDMGLQGPDHPFQGLSGGSLYIKSLIYQVF